MGKVEFQGKMVDPATTWWEWFSTSAYGVDKRLRHLFRLLPRDPRCKFCNAPFRGIGGALVKTGYGLGELTHLAPSWTRPPDLVAETVLEAVEHILAAEAR